MRKLVIGFILGSVVGAGGMYIYHKKRLEIVKKEAEIKWRDYYIDKFSPKSAGIIKDEKEDPDIIASRYSKEEKEKYEELARGYDKAESERPTDDAPEEYYEEVTPEEAAEKYEERKALAESMEAAKFDKENYRKPPEVILEDDFGYAPGFDAKEIVYYTEDGVFCDDEENIINDDVYVFGPVINEWCENPESDVIYIRNYALGCDYKVEKYNCPSPMTLHDTVID